LLFALLVSIAVSWALVPQSGRAQRPPGALGISEVSYRVDGHLLISLFGPLGSAIDATQLAVSIDGREVPAPAVSRQVPPAASVLIAVDASDSMRGAPLIAAKDAARALVDRLGPADQVGLITFADSTKVVVPLSTDRTRLRTGITNIAAGGNAGLYDAVALGANALGPASPGRHVLVVLSNAPLRKGEEVGGVSKVTRSQSLDAARRAGARIFAFGLGADPDAAYLSELAMATGGTYQAVANVQALGGVLTALGDRLHTLFLVDASIPVLANGSHEVSVRVSVAGGVETAGLSFDVTNDGLLKPRAIPSARPDGPIVITLDGPARPDTLQLTASLSGTSVPWGRDRSISIDPWAFPPGVTVVTVTAMVDGRTAATETLSIDVPQLDSTLSSRVENGPPRTLVVSGRVQGRAATIVVTGDGRELARGSAPELRMQDPPSGGLTLALLDASGAVIRTESAGVSAGVNPLAIIALVAALVAAAIATVGWQTLRRRPPRVATPGVGELQPRGVRMIGDRVNLWTPGSALAITVEGPQGDPESHPVGEGLVLGSEPSCDIVVTGPQIAPRHARVTIAPDGNLRVQRLTSDPASRSDGTAEWTILAPGEAMRIGAHTLRFGASEVAAAPGEA